MSFLIDTNVISEVRKGARCNPTVAAWWDTVAENDLWLSSLVLGELRNSRARCYRAEPIQTRTVSHHPALPPRAISKAAPKLIAPQYSLRYIAHID